jgi:hypothetical protein
MYNLISSYIKEKLVFLVSKIKKIGQNKNLKKYTVDIYQVCISIKMEQSCLMLSNRACVCVF